jgi:hypothetical protein
VTVWIREAVRTVIGRVVVTLSLITLAVTLVQFVRGSDFSGVAWLAVSGWSLFLAAFVELGKRIKEDAQRKTEVTGTIGWLIAHAMNPDLMFTHVTERATEGTVTKAEIRWPDGTPGQFWTDAVDASGAVDAYSLTYLAKGNRRIVKQPTVTRRWDGQLVSRPDLTVSDYA